VRPRKSRKHRKEQSKKNKSPELLEGEAKRSPAIEDTVHGRSLGEEKCKGKKEISVLDYPITGMNLR
jgi:hypothetical protein